MSFAAAGYRIRASDFKRRLSHFLKRLPWDMLFAAFALVVIGVLFIHSASSDFSAETLSSGGFAGKQVVFFAAAGLAMLVLAGCDYRRFAPGYWLAFAAGIGMLLTCAAIGRTINGAQSWIVIGPMSLQVAEFCKICFIVTLAGYLRYRKHVASFGALLAPLAFMGVMLALILKQPDFGTAMVFIPIFFAMMWCSGARLRHLLPLLLIGAALLPAMYFSGLFKTHQMGRVNIWLDSLTGQAIDRTGEGYHITMSMNAIGSGGGFGKGYGEGVLSQFDYLPERHNDFIFPVIAEETGFVGVFVLFAFYFMLLASCLRVAAAAREPFGRLLAVGVATMLFAQFAINIGMTCGLLPVTGIPLPLLSYGGSSLLTTLVGIGLVASVHAHPTVSIGRL